jgi:galactokinase/mevalonate kinase-like predicted kinase
MKAAPKIRKAAPKMRKAAPKMRNAALPDRISQPFIESISEGAGTHGARCGLGGGGGWTLFFCSLRYRTGRKAPPVSGLVG